MDTIPRETPETAFYGQFAQPEASADPTSFWVMEEAGNDPLLYQLYMTRDQILFDHQDDRITEEEATARQEVVDKAIRNRTNVLHVQELRAELRKPLHHPDPWVDSLRIQGLTYMDMAREATTAEDRKLALAAAADAHNRYQLHYEAFSSENPDT